MVWPGTGVMGILYFTREAASSFLNVSLSLTLTSAAVPSRITTSSPESRWMETAGLCATLLALREDRALPKYTAPSIQKPHTGMEWGRPSGRAVQIQKLRDFASRVSAWLKGRYFLRAFR